MKQNMMQEPNKASEEAQGGRNGVQNTSHDESTIVIERGRMPSPLEEVLIDFGKNLIKDSVTQSIEFNKTMLSLTATFATLMASTFGILVLGLKNKLPGAFQRTFLIIPVLMMLLSSICFALGYYPRHLKIRLQILKSIEEARDRLLRERRVWAFCGVLFFTLAILTLLIGILLINVT
jgi:hypothetical protein